LIDSIAHGQLLFAYYPDADWLSNSAYLGCQPAPASQAALAGSR
jgi:hypothetical protein